MSVRKDVGDRFAADWKTHPDLSGLDVVVSEKPLGDPRKPTALIRSRTTGREPSAPTSHRRVGLLLTIIHPSSDLDKAADELDVLVWAVLDYLDAVDIVLPPEEAEFADYGNRLLAADIPITTIAQKD